MYKINQWRYELWYCFFFVVVSDYKAVRGQYYNVQTQIRSQDCILWWPATKFGYLVNPSHLEILIWTWITESSFPYKPPPTFGGKIRLQNCPRLRPDDNSPRVPPQKPYHIGSNNFLRGKHAGHTGGNPLLTTSNPTHPPPLPSNWFPPMTGR